MIYLIHGDNHLKSRQFLQEKIKGFKSEDREIIRMPDNFKLEEVKLALESSSLFGQEKAVLIENLFSNRTTENQKAIEYLLSETKILPELVIWESKELRSPTLRKLPSTWKVELFKTPRLVFKFLDSLRAFNKKQSLTLLKECLKTEEPEFIFYMLVRQIRLLILSQEDLLEKMAPWQIGKLKKQARNFTLKELLRLHKKLLRIDTKIKTGKTLISLNQHLDLLILSL